MKLAENVLDIHSEFETEITSLRINLLKKAVNKVKAQTDAIVLFEIISLIMMLNPPQSGKLKGLLARLKTRIQSA